MIKRGGENVSCSEIENIIASHPAIVDVAVIGIVDDIRDEAIKAFIVLEEGETLTQEEFLLLKNKWRNLRCQRVLRYVKIYRVTVLKSIEKICNNRQT